MTVLEELQRAFGRRSEPHALWSRNHVPEDIDEVESYAGLDWGTLTVDHLARRFSALYFFSSEAFAYFLPRVLAAGVIEDQSDLLAFEAIIGTLDRSPRTDYWDDGFSEQWTELSAEECRAVQRWLLWMQEREMTNYENDAFDRAFDTLSLLEELAERRTGKTG